VNVRIKECDRISEPIAELQRIGVRCWEGKEVGDPDADAIIIEGSPEGYEGGIEVDGHADHRVIMLLTIVGMGCRRGLRIRWSPARGEELADLLYAPAPGGCRYHSGR
jgi:3-phosphoshikimate 1-carboxyvinyltransferase